MRNRKKFNFIIILVLVLFLSVGYAVVNSISLTITGSAGAGSEEINTFFTGDYTVVVKPINVTNSNLTYYDVSATMSSTSVMCPSSSDIGDYQNIIVTVK